MRVIFVYWHYNFVLFTCQNDKYSVSVCHINLAGRVAFKLFDVTIIVFLWRNPENCVTIHNLHDEYQFGWNMIKLK